MSFVGNSEALKSNRIAVPDTAREAIVKPLSFKGFSSVVPTSSVASTVPDTSEPVRTLASGIVLNTTLSRYASPECLSAGGDQLYPLRLTRTVLTCCSHDSYTNGPVPITFFGSLRCSALSFSVDSARITGCWFEVIEAACSALASGLANLMTAVYGSGVSVPRYPGKSRAPFGRIASFSSPLMNWS